MFPFRPQLDFCLDAGQCSKRSRVQHHHFSNISETHAWLWLDIFIILLDPYLTVRFWLLPPPFPLTPRGWLPLNHAWTQQRSSPSLVRYLHNMFHEARVIEQCGNVPIYVIHVTTLFCCRAISFWPSNHAHAASNMPRISQPIDCNTPRTMTAKRIWWSGIKHLIFLSINCEPWRTFRQITHISAFLHVTHTLLIRL